MSEISILTVDGVSFNLSDDALRSNISGIENNIQSSKDYNIGDYLIYDSGFYKVIEVITSGDLLEIDVNITSVKVGDELKAKASIDSPTFFGSPKVPTANIGDRSTQIASTAYVQNEIDVLKDNIDSVQDDLIKLDDTITDRATAVASSMTTSWLNAHITNTDTVLLDTSLTVEGAAADSKAVGDAIQSVINGELENAISSLREEMSIASEALDSNTADISNLTDNVTRMDLDIGRKVDGGYVSDGVAYFTSGDDVLFEITGIGGGGGGESSGNSALISVTNMTGWIAKTVSFGYSCFLSFNWSSLEDDQSTGSGNMTVTVNGSAKFIQTIQQGEVSINVANYLSTGTNIVKIKVSDVYGNNRTLSFSITMVALKLSSTFSTDLPFTGSISFPYIPTGNVEKFVHFIIDGLEIGTQTTSVSGRQQTYTIPKQSHGNHTLRVYFESTISGQEVFSNELYYDLICLDSGIDTPVISSDYDQDTVVQYSSINIPYIVYDPSRLLADVSLKVNGVEINLLTVDRTRQMWTYRASNIGELVLSIQCGSSIRTFTLDVIESDMNSKAETEDLALYLTSEGRSNGELNPSVWNYNDISAVLSGFNFVSDGWVHDEENNTVLRVSGNARVEIPYKIFGSDLRVTGKTIEFEFETRNVRNYDTVILSCYSDGRGIQLTPQKMFIKSEQSYLEVPYKENEHVRVSFVIEKLADHRLLMYCYLNGIMSAVTRYSSTDDFQQSDLHSVGITIGSDLCTTDIYNIRIYDNDLTRYQILDNWIADTQNVDLMLSRYRRNNIFDAYGSIVIGQLPGDLPYLILQGPELPKIKGDKKTMSGSYTDPLHKNKSFTFTGAQVDVQGTSSQYYARKNYKIKFKNGFVIDGATGSKYAMNDDAIPVNTFTFKADVASSEGANNVELVRLYDLACPYKTPSQRQNSKVRQGIDGFPIVIFWDNGTDITFIGKYNFNNDKSTEEVFGFVEGDESWEIKNNTSNRVIWKDDNFVGDDWLNDFEARYPDTDPVYTDNTQLSEFATWLKSTDRSSATDEPLGYSVTYGGVVYSFDTSEYRLAKFKAEVGRYTELESSLFYYLFTELFLMVDSRAKNAFPSFIGGGFNLNVSLTLNHVTAFNTQSEINKFDSYVNTFTLDNNAVFGSAVVFMGGVDVTSDVWELDTMTVSIPEVTGDLFINVLAYSITEVPVTWSGSGVNKYSSIIDSTSGDVYFEVPYESSYSFSGEITSESFVGRMRTHLYRDANCEEFVGFYYIDSGKIEDARVDSECPAFKFSIPVKVAPKGYYTKLDLFKSSFGTFDSNSSFMNYLNTYANKVYIYN